MKNKKNTINSCCMCPFRETKVTCNECETLGKIFDFADKLSFVNSYKDKEELTKAVKEVVYSKNKTQ
jgi:hypothetical protein